MKVASILLAVLCSAIADHHAEHHDPCLHACKEQIKTKIAADSTLSHMTPDHLTTTEGRTHIRQFVKDYIAGTGPILPGEAWKISQTWTKMCTLSTEAETCINACPESPKREGAKKFLSVFKLGCDADFISSLPCLSEVHKTPSETCQTKCTPLASKLSHFIRQRDEHPDERTPASIEVLVSGCKFVNCRLNCRKNDVVTKCQDKGFEQAKKLVSAMAISNKMLYKRAGGDLTNWPEECKSDKVIEHHEY